MLLRSTAENRDGNIVDCYIVTFLDTGEKKTCLDTDLENSVANNCCRYVDVIETVEQSSCAATVGHREGSVNKNDDGTLKAIPNGWEVTVKIFVSS